jgi:hypothetical protein
MEVGIGGGVEEVVGEEGGGFVGGDAAILLVPLFLVDALGAEACEESFTGFDGAGFFVDAFDNAFDDCLLNGDLVKRPSHGVAVFGVLDELIEEGADAAVGGDDGELAAPGGDGFGNAVKEALVLVEREFVEGDMAAFAGQGVGIRGKGIDTAAIGELEDVSGGIGVRIEEKSAEILGGDVHEFSPVKAIFELEFGLELIAGRNEGIETRVVEADETDEAIGVAIGKTNLAGFDGEFEGGLVLDPIALGGVEVGGWGVHGGGMDCWIVGLMDCCVGRDLNEVKWVTLLLAYMVTSLNGLNCWCNR